MFKCSSAIPQWPEPQTRPVVRFHELLNLNQTSSPVWSLNRVCSGSKLDFGNTTQTNPTSHHLRVLQRQSHDFIIVSPPSFQLHHLLSHPIVSWSCWDPDQVTFPLPLSYSPYSRFYFWVFHGHSSAPCYYHPIFHIFSDFIVSFVLSFLVSIFLALKTLYIVDLPNRSPPLPHFGFKVPPSPTKSYTSFSTLSKPSHCILTSHVSIFSHVTTSSSLYCITTMLLSSMLCLSSFSWVSFVIQYSCIIVFCVYLISDISFCTTHHGVHLLRLDYITKSTNQVDCVRDLSQCTCTPYLSLCFVFPLWSSLIIFHICTLPRCISSLTSLVAA